jgi:hypothetical protein
LTVPCCQVDGTDVLLTGRTVSTLTSSVTHGV